MKISAKEIAEKVRGEIRGDETRILVGIKPLDLASIDELSFFAPTSKKKTAELFELAKKTNAGAILVPEFEDCFTSTQIKVQHPLAALVALAPFFRVHDEQPGIHPTAVIHETAEVDPAVSVGPYVVIGARAKIGPRVTLHPHVVIYSDVWVGEDSVVHSGAVIREGSRLGKDCLVQPGVVVGGDGFGYIPDPAIGHRRIPHLGQVILEDGVDLGANTTVDRATFGETRIGAFTKIDNLVMIAHNVKIGEKSILCGQVGISGSSEIGNQVVLAGQVGVADHVNIGDRVRVAAKSGISSDIEPGIDVAGYPHQEASSWRRTQVALRYLPDLIKKKKLR